MEKKIRIDLVALINLDKFEAFDDAVRFEARRATQNGALVPYIIVNGPKNYYTYGQFVHAYRRGYFLGRDVVELCFDGRGEIPAGFKTVEWL